MSKSLTGELTEVPAFDLGSEYQTKATRHFKQWVLDRPAVSVVHVEIWLFKAKPAPVPSTPPLEVDLGLSLLNDFIVRFKNK